MAERTRRRDGQAGVTLVELLVVMVIMGVLGTMILTSFVGTERASSRTMGQLDSIAQTRVAVNAIAKSLRAAVRATATDPLLRVARPREVVYLADLPGQDAPDQVRISVRDGELLEERWTADSGSGPSWTFTGAAASRPLLADVPDDLVVLHYRDLDACPVGTDCPELDAGATAEGLSAQDRNSVDLVEIVVLARTVHADPVEVRTRIVLRNEGFVPDGTEVSP